MLKALGDANNPDCEIQIQYADEEGILIMKLYEDLQNDHLVIM